MLRHLAPRSLVNALIASLCGLSFSTLLALAPASADEGMWTFNGFPSQAVDKAYHFSPTQPWLDHVRLSSARLAGGCSGSFVSNNGLVMTNHHCAHSCIEQLSNSKKDFVQSGFFAKEEKDEVHCPEIEVNRLTAITDVTSQMRAKTKGLTGKDFNRELKAEMSTVEKECAAGSDEVRCDVVTLFHGGRYNLYKYRRYQDVRLVFAPEISAAFFGGDPDNFMFPRFDLDVSFLRVYDHGAPLQGGEHFTWSKDGAKDGQLTFVTGHPGGTSRLLTISELEFARDVKQTNELINYSELRGLLIEFGRRGKEEKRISEARLFSVENRLKALKGKHAALLDPVFFAEKVKAEKAFRKKVAARPALKKQFGSAWDEMSEAQKQLRLIYISLNQTEQNSFGSHLYSIAKDLVRASIEIPKPNPLRFREFADSALPQLKQELFSTAPIYNQFEIELMTYNLTRLRELLTADDPFVKQVLGQKSPSELAEELIKGTKLGDVKVRQQLFDGGADAVAKSTDPMILFARMVEPTARKYRVKYRDEIESKIEQAAEKIAQAKFAVDGDKEYPDATFTLRLSYGQVKGYQEGDHEVKPITNFAGAFDRNSGRDPFALPPTWIAAKDKLDMATPLDFCSTNDIIGGNSGSPVVNQNAEVVGLIFDGNIESLGGDYGYDARVNRAVAVHSSALIEALDKIYGAHRIVEELRSEAK